MSSQRDAVAIVGLGALLPDAPDVAAFWRNLTEGRYSVSDVPPDRWDPSSYYDPDPLAPDKTYSRIGGWVREYEWNPLAWKMPIPPRVAELMDRTQKWAIIAARQALLDYGYPARPLDPERTAVILGNAMGGDMHLFSAARILYPEFAGALAEGASFAELPAGARATLLEEMRAGIGRRMPVVNEDTMPGELSNIAAGRIAALYDFRGPNYVTDAACASAMAAMDAAADGLLAGDFDAVLAGGIDSNMSPTTFVKFSKIGALSATGSRPYAAGADGFVMGEGGAILVLKRLADAERDGDRIYALLVGIGGSSDGRGKGITAPNPAGQKLAVRRAWVSAGAGPEAGDLIEGHGTSTPVGDVVEVESLTAGLDGADLPPASVPLGSVKSNFGHLKGASGAAGVLKATLALHHKLLPPSLNFERPNPGIDFAHSPFYVNTVLAPWKKPTGTGLRRAGVSAFGFGGTNFHVVLEEYVPGRRNGRPTSVSVLERVDGRDRSAADRGAHSATAPTATSPASSPELKTPLRGALVIGGADENEIARRLRPVRDEAAAGHAPAPQAPLLADLRAAVRLAIDYGDSAELADKASLALAVLSAPEAERDARWKAARARGIYLGRGDAEKVAFLYTGQGSQYVNMLAELRAREPIVAETFAEADRVMEPLLGAPLTSYIFVDPTDTEAIARAEEQLKQTEITQPAVLATDDTLTALLQAYGVRAEFVMGHSLGEYGALVAAGAMPLGDALKAVSARGHAMAEVSFEDNGIMAAVFGSTAKVQEVLDRLNGDAVIANINSSKECVIGGATEPVQRAIAAMEAEGLTARVLPVSHAFHTHIVSPASEPLATTLRTLSVSTPSLPIVANLTGDFYPPDATREQIIDILAQQVGSPVQFVKGLETLYAAGARVFVEVGPKRALAGFADDVLGTRPDVVALFTNHPKLRDDVAFNQALCGLYAAGHGAGREEDLAASTGDVAAAAIVGRTMPAAAAPAWAPAALMAPIGGSVSVQPQPQAVDYNALGRLFADFMDRGFAMYSGGRSAPPARIGITGVALGLPGTERMFDDANLEAVFRGVNLIESIPADIREAMARRRITRLVKSAEGEAHFETIEDPREVVKLAGRGHAFDLQRDFGFPADRLEALDRVTRIAIAAGVDALRDAGIPLVMRYRTTTRGTQLPDRWMLPESLRDDTGVIFGSAFPALDSFVEIVGGYYEDQQRRARVAELESLLAETRAAGEERTEASLEARLAEARTEVEAKAYRFDRRFLFRVLSMGHSQFAEYIGARGPNTQINVACATGSAALALASDWIREGRCRRVIIVTADDVTSDNLLPWFGSGFVASGAAATDEHVEDAALPFDRRRHGLIIGMGGAALVVESLDAAAERGLQPICQVLATAMANSAYHGSRLDVPHISDLMERLIAGAESTWGLSRAELARELVFVSHETYTPARGGSASAEVMALRRVFGHDAARIVVANTKGYTGHPMAVAMEEVLTARMLETGLIPPVANFREVDPELGALNLSQGGAYAIRYALRLGAGFGSQISMALLQWMPPVDGRRTTLQRLGYGYRIVDANAWNAWLRRVTGEDAPELEVVGRTLRVRHDGALRNDRPVPLRPEALPGVYPMPAPIAAAPVTGVAPPAPAAAAAMPAAPTTVADPVRDAVLAIVAAKTGYPPDMLDLDLDLEADLGIDTVKQAETFAAIRAAYDIPADESVKLRDYPTLGHAVRFVYDNRPDLEAPATTAPVATAAAPITPAAAAGPTAPSAPPALEAASAGSTLASAAGRLGADPVRDTVLGIVAEKTGYPPDMLDLDLDLEADLGIDTVKQAETFAAIRAAYDIRADESVKLRDYPTLGHAVRFVYDHRPDLAPPSPGAPSGSVVAAAAPADAAAEGKLAAPSAAQAASVATDGVRETVLGIVAAQTGYPPDMLDLDLDLEADLGIDTVKQAEMFAAIRSAYDIARDDRVKLRNYPTLAHAIEFAYASRPELRGAAPAQTPGAAPSQSAGTVEAAASAAAPRDASGSLQARFEAAALVPRRVPVPRLRPPARFCKPTSVRLGPGTRVVVVGGSGKVGQTLARRLEKLGATVLRIDDAPPAEELAARLQAWNAEGPIQGVYWLPALEPLPAPESLAPDEWREALRVTVKLLYAGMRALPDLAAAGQFVVAATRLGGRHGYDDSGAVAPLGGAVTGFVKTLGRERPALLAKAVDFEARCDARAIVDRLLAETLTDPGAVEIGYAEGERWTVALEERPLAPEPGLALGPETTFIVTGAAGSIVSAIVADLAAASGGTFFLLDLTPEPDRADADIPRLGADRDGLRRDLVERMKARGERPTPAAVERQLAALERSAAALAAIQAVEAAGGKALYRSVNLLDADAVGAIVREALALSGGVDVLLHAAGMESSHLLPDKPPAEFDRVFDVKADGWYNLVSALGAAPLRAAVAFSSIAARFGNAGQADYSAANDLLCKLLSSLRAHSPETRGLAIDWTGWEGIGMASRGSIPVLLKQAGLELLPPEQGVAIVRRELTLGAFSGEVVVAKALGEMVSERHASGGLDTDLVEAATSPGPMIGRARAMGVQGGLVVDTPLDPARQPFLFDHRIDETPVLPGVMGLEGMAETAALLWPDRRVARLEEVRFLAPFKFHRSRERTVELRAEPRLEGGALVASCSLLGSRLLHGQSEPETTTHFQARVVLSVPGGEGRSPRTAVPAPDHDVLTPEAIYRVYFHGPAYRVLEAAWRSGERFVGRFADSLPPNHQPRERPLLVAPRLIELAFQTAGLAELLREGRMGLPSAIESVELFGQVLEQDGPYHAIATTRPDGRHDVDVVNGDGRVCVALRGYSTAALPGAIDTAALEPLRTVTA